MVLVFFFFLMIRPPPRSTRVRSSAASDVYKRQIQSQGIITRDNVSVDVSAVAYFKVVDAVKSVVAIENVHAAIDQIAQTTLRKVVGQHTLDETLSETDRINLDIREILDVTTVEWGVEVTLVELKDIQLPDTM